jgi:hypothetical protein
MASTYSDRLKLELMATGANVDSWGNVTNSNLQVVDAFNAGYLAKSVAGSADVTLTTANRDPSAESSNKVIEFTGELTGDIKVFVPAVENNYIFFNNTTGSFTLTVAPTGHASNGVAISQGAHTVQYCTGDTIVDLFASTLGDVRVINQLKVGTNIQLNSNGVVAATTVTGNGAGLSGVNEFPSGTKVMFAQADAPTGFTKDTTASLNNSTLRVVSGTGGGSTAGTDFTSTFTAKNATGTLTVDMSPVANPPVSGTTGAHTVSTPELSSHTHSVSTSNVGPPVVGPTYSRNFDASNLPYSRNPGTTPFGNAGGGGSHTHGIGGEVGVSGNIPVSVSQSVPNMTLKYVDSIIASQD